MGYIDCDSHVLENDETWSYLSTKDLQYRPFKVQLPASPHLVKRAAAPPVSIWLVQDTWVTAAPTDGNMRDNANVYDTGAVMLTDLSTRIQDMDALGIDVQLLLSTFFLGVELENPAAEVALTWSYNRWVAEHVLPQYRARLPWAVRAPLRNIAEAHKALDFGKEHGAAGLQVRGLEYGMYLGDSYFDPIWEHVNDLEMAVFVHLGDATRRIDNQPLGRTISSPAAMTRQLFPLMAGFHAVLGTDFEKRFPKIRWGFLEGGAAWGPVVVRMDTRLRSSAEEFLRLNPVSHQQLEDKQVFITIEADDPMDYIASVMGEGIFAAGTDYGHNDRGTELGTHTAIAERTDLSTGFIGKIVDVNGRRLLGVKDDFRPAPEAKLGPLPHTRGASTPDGEPLLLHHYASA